VPVEPESGHVERHRGLAWSVRVEVDHRDHRVVTLALGEADDVGVVDVVEA
jgi:hypothetical protein